MRLVEVNFKKWRMMIIFSLIIALLLGVVVFLFRKNAVLANDMAKLQQDRSQVVPVREELEAISEFAAYRFHYTTILNHDDNIKWIGVNIPFTNTEYIASIDGAMSIGIKTDKIQYEEIKDKDGKFTKVIFKVPHSQILTNATDSKTLKEYDYDKNIFNPVEPGEYNQLRVKAEAKEKKKVLKSDILKKSDKRIANLLRAHFQAIYGKDVEIEIQYLAKNKK